MNQLKGSCLIAQSGGPTAVINASLCGAVSAALCDPAITRVLGAANGIVGVLQDKIYDLDREDPRQLDLLRYTPSSALGTCRHKLPDPEADSAQWESILDIFKKYNVRYFFYIGGNDSMDTCEKLSRYTRNTGYECRVIGIPKTIDNDLCGTDHCPGYGSAARYVATSFMELSLDTSACDSGQITVVEVMGRHAGWLTASACLATHMGSGPDLIYLPEKPFDRQEFFSACEKLYARSKKVLVAVSEGLRDASGNLLAQSSHADAFGHAQLGGLAHSLAGELQQLTGAKVRPIEFSLLQRCASHCASRTDMEEAYNVGLSAVLSATGGLSGQMMALKRRYIDGEYCSMVEAVPLSLSANKEKRVPAEWIHPDNSGMSRQFVEYALPLIQGEPERPLVDSLPLFADLRLIRA